MQARPYINSLPGTSTPFSLRFSRTWRGEQSHSHGLNCEALVFSLSDSFDGIQGITLEASYAAIIPWSNRMSITAVLRKKTVAFARATERYRFRETLHACIRQNRQIDGGIEDDYHYAQQQLKLTCQVLRVEDRQQIPCDEVGRIESLATLRVQLIF